MLIYKGGGGGLSFLIKNKNKIKRGFKFIYFPATISITATLL